MNKRLSTLRQTLNEHTGILLSSKENEYYFLDFELADSYLLITKQKAYIITDFRYTETAEKNSSPDFEVVDIMQKGIFKTLADDNKLNTLFFEDRDLTCNIFEDLKSKLPDINFLPLGRKLEETRQYKDEFEIECIIKAQRIAEKSFDELLPKINPDMTETDLAAELEYLMKRNGSRNPSFNTIVISGKSTSLPHGIPQNKKLEKGFVTIDFGAIFGGYHSDMTRTFSIGKASEDMKKVYTTVLTAQLKAIEAMENGERNCVKIDGIARSYIYENGYEGMFGHGLGHGVGLQIHELPRLSPSFPRDAVLKKGHIVTVEPGIYVHGKYGVRIEDMVYIDDNCIKNLTNTPKNLIEL